MLDFLFVKKHKDKVCEYILNVGEGGVYPPSEWFIKRCLNKRVSYPSEFEGKRYALPDTYSEKEAGESVSSGENASDTRPEIKRSGSGSALDGFNPETVAAAMEHFLNGDASEAPFVAKTNLTFVQRLKEHIRDKDLVEADVYKAALMDRRLFSKIVCNENYKPSKDTALALVFALELSLPEANDLLERAGYTLSHSIRKDIIAEYFIKEEIYNLKKINAMLYDLDEKIIGRDV